MINPRVSLRRLLTAFWKIKGIKRYAKSNAILSAWAFSVKIGPQFFSKKKLDYFNVDLLALSCIHKRIPYLT